MNDHNHFIQAGHKLIPGYQYAVKMPDYDGDGLVPYPTSMFAFELPANYQMIACTGVNPPEMEGESEEYLFEFIQYKPQVATSAAEFRGLAQPYESNHPGHLRKRRHVGPAHTGEAQQTDMVPAPASVQERVQPVAQPQVPQPPAQPGAVNTQQPAGSGSAPPPPGGLNLL